MIHRREFPWDLYSICGGVLGGQEGRDKRRGHHGRGCVERNNTIPRGQSWCTFAKWQRTRKLHSQASWSCSDLRLLHQSHASVSWVGVSFQGSSKTSNPARVSSADSLTLRRAEGESVTRTTQLK